MEVILEDSKVSLAVSRQSYTTSPKYNTSMKQTLVDIYSSQKYKVNFGEEEVFQIY